MMQSHKESHERASAGNSEDKIKLALFQRSARILELGNSSKNQLHLTMRNDCLFLLYVSGNEFSNQTSQFKKRKVKKLTVLLLENISPDTSNESHSQRFSRDLFSSQFLILSRSLSLKIAIWILSGCLT